jgi:hypothetical protein
MTIITNPFFMAILTRLAHEMRDASTLPPLG